MPSKNDWTRPQVLAALHLYHLLPFGKLDRNTPQVKQLGIWLGRTASAVAHSGRSIPSARECVEAPQLPCAIPTGGVMAALDAVRR